MSFAYSYARALKESFDPQAVGQVLPSGQALSAEGTLNVLMSTNQTAGQALPSEGTLNVLMSTKKTVGQALPSGGIRHEDDQKKSENIIRHTAQKREDNQEQDFFALIEALNKFNKAFREPEINLFFLSPAIPLEVKKQALKKVFEHLGYKGLICSFLYLLLDKKRWGELPAIIKHLNKIKGESQGFVPVEVESAFPLSEKLKEQLGQKLYLFLGKHVHIKENLNPHLIGGMKIRAKGFVFDDNLSYHLKQMETM